MTLRRLPGWIAMAALLAAGAGCVEGERDGERQGARRGRGAPTAEMSKENVSKVTYPVDVATPGAAAGPGGWRDGQLQPTDPVLDDRTHYDVWLLSGQAGERFIITMESADFDAFLIVAGPIEGSPAILAEDDDGAGGTDARIELVIPETGRYAVIANSVFPSEIGSYRIRMELAETTVERPTGWRAADDR